MTTTHPTTPDQGDERIRDCFNCIDGTKPPAACRRCTACIDDDARPNWFPKDGAEREYRSWLPILSAAQPVAPDGYALISVDALRAWGKLDEVTAACKYPIAAPQPSQGAELSEEDVKHIIRTTPGPDGYRAALVRAGYALGVAAAPHHPASAEAGKEVVCTVRINAHRLFLEDWNQAVLNTLPDGDIDLYAAPSESVAVSGEVSDTLALLVECRDAFPVPPPGSPLEQAWAQAMGEPECIPDYLRAAVLALAGSAKQAAALERMARLDDEMGIEP